MKKSNTTYQLKVYFDGACSLCSREIEYYQKKPQAKKIQWVDVSQPFFDATQEGLDPELVQTKMHVIQLRDQKVFTGVDAFLTLWKTLGCHSFLSRCIQLSVLRPFFDLSYTLFARFRRYVPKRKDKVRSTDDTIKS